ncbi:MAG: 50S ribosomal protein L6 [Opitutales bacterium]
MSRIGKLPVAIPEKVKINIVDNTVQVEGPKGKLSREFDRAVSIEIDEGTVKVKPNGNSRHSRAMYGTARSIIDNMVSGVVSGYSKNLAIEGVGFKATLKGKVLDLALGYAHPVLYNVPEGITITITENTKIKVEGPDKQMVGQVAADIKSFYPVEPYKGKGVRILGDFVRRKEGKKTS